VAGISGQGTIRALNRAPLAGRYPASVAISLLGLCPFIVLTTAFTLTEKSVIAGLHTTTLMAMLSDALANAAYAFGAVTGADLILRIPQRWLFIGCEAVFTIGSLLSASASGMAVFMLGRVLQGFTTGIMLVVGLPPLVTSYGSGKLPLSAMYTNLGLFGMVTLGPVAGGVASGYHSWRLLFAAIGALGVCGMLTGLLAYRYNPAPAPAIGFDVTAVPLAFAGTFLPFFAVTWLSVGGFTSAGFLAPLLTGMGALFALVVIQFFKAEALMPVRPISHTLPVVGIGTAMIGGATFVVFLELIVVYMTMVTGTPPIVAGGLLAPMLIGIAAGAWLFMRMLPSRWLPVLVLSGLGVIAAAGAMLLGLHRGDAMALVPVVAVLLGFGAGGAVAPGLFMAGFSVPSSRIGPTFALVELLRSEAAFILAPVLEYVAVVSVGTLSGGIHLATGVTFGLLVIIAPMLLGVLLLGGAGPHPPDLDTWLEGEKIAYDSPRIAAAIRGR